MDCCHICIVIFVLSRDRTFFNNQCRYCGIISGTDYGQGVYFARDAAYSVKYALGLPTPRFLSYQPSTRSIHKLSSLSLNWSSTAYPAHGSYCETSTLPKGPHFMYLSRVLVGQYCIGKRSMVVPPPKDPSQPEILFDSMVDNKLDPNIFVVFHDAQCYPEYLITF